MARIAVQPSRASYSAPMAWSHNPAHRLGVPYSSASVAGRFGGTVNGYRGGSTFRSTTPGYGARPYASTGYRSPSCFPFGNRSTAPAYSRSYNTPAMPSRSYGFSSPSYGNPASRSFASPSMSRNYSPQYAPRSSLPSGGYSGSSSARGFSGGGQHFSAPRASGGGGGHFSAPHSSGGGHSSGGHSSAGHSGGGHHR